MGKKDKESTGNRFVNPVDKVRKYSKKKEKIKNKNERKMSRGEMIRAKEPKKMLDEMYLLDEEEFLLSQGPPTPQLNLVKEKRRKLKDNFEKVLTFYQRDNKEKFEQIKRWQHEYDIKRRNIRFNLMEKEKEKNAQLFANDPLKHMLAHIPLPGEAITNKPKIENIVKNVAAKIQHMHIPLLPENILPPGPPPTLPPEGSVKIPDEYMNKYINPNIIPLNYSYENFFDPIPPPPPPQPHNTRNHRNVTHTFIDKPVEYQHEPYLGRNSSIEQSNIETPVVIAATAQMRDMQAEVTRLIPISVLKKKNQTINKVVLPSTPISLKVITNEKEQAYNDFLNELNNL